MHDHPSNIADLLARAWCPLPGAPAEEITRLLQTLPFTPPEEYIALLRLSNGGEGELALEPGWFQLFDVGYAIQQWGDSQYRAEYPNYFFFGTNGGLESLAMVICASGPWPIVMVDPIAGIGSSTHVAASFREFLQCLGVRGAG